jgi:catechol O-methyltransferase
MWPILTIPAEVESPKMRRLTEIGGKRLPFMRWSFLRMILGMKRLTTEWQVGDGREQALRDHVLANARAGDLDDAIRAVDEFCYEQSFMMNVGDEKGEILDAAIRRADPRRLLELGTYCGYSALRTARAMSEGAHLTSIEFSADNAALARAILEHAGVADRVTVVHGTIGDGGATIAALESEHGFTPGSVDFVFLDHAKDAYLPDLKRIVEAGWLHPGSVVVADNVKFPGVPDYREFMSEHEGSEWRTTEHETHVEYQSVIKDLVLESEYAGAA